MSWMATAHQKISSVSTFLVRTYSTKLNAASIKPRISHKKFLLGLKVYKEILGDTQVPLDFVIPSDDARWPKELQGGNLGRKAKEIRIMFHRNVLTTSYIKDLEDIQFSWSSNARDYRWNEIVLPTLQQYKNIYGNLQVPFDFVVPSGEPWPAQAWGWNFGSTVGDIRSRQDYVRNNEERKQLLNDMGFVWNFLETRYEQLIFPSLETYRNLHGHLDIPKSFVVPEDKHWPEKTHRFRLGDAVNKIRMGTYMKKYPERQKRLNELGFDWGCSTFRFNTVLVPVLKLYLSTYQTLNIPLDFHVPSELPWPLEAHGIHLGKIVQSFRVSDSYAQVDREKKKQLDDLGLQWEI